MKIDKNIPMPVSVCTYPFIDMEVGDSIMIKANEKNIRQVQASLYNSASQFCSRHKKQWKFKTRQQQKIGVRIWRVM